MLKSLDIKVFTRSPASLISPASMITLTWIRSLSLRILLCTSIALDLYRGPRTIQAEGINGDPQHCSKGILQGCPQAPAISKLTLFKPLRALVTAHPAVSLQTWVDDVSFDIHAAREVGAFRTLKYQMEQAGLKAENTDKTGPHQSTCSPARGRS